MCRVNRSVQGHCESDRSNGTDMFLTFVCWVLIHGTKLLRRRRGGQGKGSGSKRARRGRERDVEHEMGKCNIVSERGEKETELCRFGRERAGDRSVNCSQWPVQEEGSPFKERNRESCDISYHVKSLCKTTRWSKAWISQSLRSRRKSWKFAHHTQTGVWSSNKVEKKGSQRWLHSAGAGPLVTFFG